MNMREVGDVYKVEFRLGDLWKVRARTLTIKIIRCAHVSCKQELIERISGYGMYRTAH
jgi:hypothetical protein